MRQVPRVSRLVGGNIGTVQAAPPFFGFFHFAEAGFPENFVEMCEVESGAMLSVAENEIGKPAAERIEMAGKGIVEPLVLSPAIGLNGTFEIGNDHANSAARLQH